jgi:hypothetical protein
MKSFSHVAIILIFASCKSSIKLSIPEAFKAEATQLHVQGARKNKMSFGEFTTSKIRRGVNVKYPGWSRFFFLENLLLKKYGVQIDENITKQKHSYRYTISNGKTDVKVFAKEKEITKKFEVDLPPASGIFNKIETLEEYKYVFSALISTDTTIEGNTWELLMTNIYNSGNDMKKKIFPIIRPDESGLASNGKDTIFIKPIQLKKTESPNGKVQFLPFKLLTGYELSNSEGLIGIVDLIDRDVWFYKELNETEKLTLAAISTVILARRVSNNQW